MIQDERISDIELGERLRIARVQADVTQATAAEFIGAVRTTIVAIEKGQRKVKLSELQKLANEYGTSVNALLRKEAIHLDLTPHFRKPGISPNEHIATSAQLLNSLVRGEMELENALGVIRQRAYPTERPILPGDVVLQAEQEAQRLRDELGLGDGPVPDIISLLEVQLGIRVYVRPLPPDISGLFAYDDTAGACILINSKHSKGRRNQTGAHELGHFIGTRNDPEALMVDDRFQSRSERYADSFGRAFKTPARAVRQMFARLTAGQSHLTRRHVILLADHFGVSREAIVRRLEELQIVKSGTWDWFLMNGGITQDHVREVLGDTSNEEEIEVGTLPQRLIFLAREAYKQEIYSEGQLRQLLSLSPKEVRDILSGIEEEVEEADEQSELRF